MGKIEIKGAQEVLSVSTAAEFEKVLEAYKLANPEKYALKLASGEFERQKMILGIKDAPKETPKEEKSPEEKKSKKAN